MQNRYVGDVGDFAKYALLNMISPNLPLGIVWCLYPDESHNSDGRHIGYLEKSEFRNLDCEVFDRLKKLVKNGNRTIRSVVRSGVLPKGAVSYAQAITSLQAGKRARETHRFRWLAGALRATDQCDLVFFDPDNGLETPSVKKGAPKSGKYIYLDELQEFWDRGQSLLIYHHLNRTASIEMQTLTLKKRFHAAFPYASGIVPLLFRRGSCRQFWTIAQGAHATELSTRIDQISGSPWGAYLEAC